MTREVYNVLKSRIGKVSYEEGRISYRFFNDGLNEGIEEYDVLYLESIVFDMKVNPANIWNVCQKCYKYLRWMVGYSEDTAYLDSRLLNS